MTSTLGTLFFSGCSLDKLLLEVGIQITRMGIVEANDSELKRKTGRWGSIHHLRILALSLSTRRPWPQR